MVGIRDVAVGVLAIPGHPRGRAGRHRRTLSAAPDGNVQPTVPARSRAAAAAPWNLERFRIVKDVIRKAMTM